MDFSKKYTYLFTSRGSDFQGTGTPWIKIIDLIFFFAYVEIEALRFNYFPKGLDQVTKTPNRAYRRSKTIAVQKVKLYLFRRL